MTDRMDKLDELKLLQKEILNLFNYIQRVRQEVAAITRPAEGEDNRFNSMSDQLDAIIQATEDATNSIMEVAEANEGYLNLIREKTTDPEILKILDDMETNSSRVYEACAFQDITGQRVTKIARSITYVDARVNALIDLFGKDHLDSVELGDEHVTEESEDEKLLSGPQLEGRGVTQDEIDKLFD